MTMKNSLLPGSCRLELQRRVEEMEGEEVAVEYVWFKCWSYRSRSYRSRGLGVEHQEEVAVECVWFKCWRYRNRSYRSRRLGVEQREGLQWYVCGSNPEVIILKCLFEVLI